MEKKISLKNSNVLIYTRAIFLGIIVSLIGLLAFALVMKFVILSDNFISAVNQGIKAVSLFIAIKYVSKFYTDKLIVRSLVIGLLYAIFAYLIFSILNGSFAFNMGTLTDILFAVITAFICGIIIKLLFNRK
ncbi:MAG: YrzE family protein [Clostridia bacterium]|nr:YrzE family protein [Clostridia bacterium]